jgi:hypothetical protein
VPTALAIGVCRVAATVPVSEVVSALEKCQSMAIKIKAAKFLRSNSKEDLASLRAYAESLIAGDNMKGEENEAGLDNP